MKILLLTFLLLSSLFGASELVTQTKEFFNSSLFEFDNKSITLVNIIKATILLVVGFMLGFIYKRWVVKITRKHDHISMMTIRLMSNIGYYLIIIIFVISAVSALGINMSSLSLIAGALSIGIGFGLQTVVSNLIAGIIIMFERTIRIGDIIEVNGNISGTVTDMRIRSTTVKTFDNIDIIVPNSSFIQNNVVNLTLEDRIRRLHIPFGVAYGSEIQEVKKIIIDALENSELVYVRDDEDKKPDVRMTLMNASSVDLELIVWVNRDPKQTAPSLPSDFLILIYDALRANDINIPFPQIDVHMKSE